MRNDKTVKWYIAPDLLVNSVYARYMCVYLVVTVYICFNGWNSRVILPIHYGCVQIKTILFLC